MTRATYHHGDLRAALLRSALELLESSGSDGLSLRAVARAAGVSPNAPYRHYADKEALLAALAVHGFGEMAERVIAALATAAPEDLVVVVVTEGVRHGLANPGLHQLMVDSTCSTRPEVQEASARALAEVATSLGVTTTCTDETGALATGVWALVHGLYALLRDGAVRPGPGEDVDALVARIVRATVGPLPGVAGA
ncbi:TetR/AcrR family transcriptional regulator [Actinosynnema pretiosum subsp. pretiosum]|uniref:TetR/AcrR family transcriptional regulator n=1 Tax=Actinosynnema pretiosum subsp. pretiosum TaxID=103721 RepID=A0AA45LA47_9PSEU|nr:Transcriptional regulator, TetR family [Actinosynnema pretiosum subsp. pretiosum]QUF06157.1 TetR/AcrR family transcriptional regulator [Actinosynnema pretiosum subsp. pretiosum]